MSDINDNDEEDFSEVSSIGSNLVEDPGLDFYQVTDKMCRAIYVVAGGQEGICNRLPPCHRHHHRTPTTP
jgi:hypothetical protein